MKEKRLITAALPYTNQVPHLGNMVGSHLPADIFARYCRLAGYDAILIGGTDENGTTTEVAAQKYGITPKQLTDFFYKIHKEIYDWFNISYDNFSRTSKKIHYETTKEIFLRAYENGYISEKIIKIPFCKKCDRALSDRYIKGTCPYCGYEDAKGDQCEKCGRLLDPVELKNPRCAVCNSDNIIFEEKKHLFLELPLLSNKIEKYIKKNKNLRAQVKNIGLAWIKEGLKPRDITRDIKWGIPVPVKGYENSVIYSWFDAPLGYISSTKEWNKERWKEFWKNKDAKIYHFLGKDNIPFHVIFFEGILLATDSGFNLPYNVVGLQYLNYERGKFSKSQGHGVFCENLPKAGLESDYWRFYLAYIIPETKDTEFLWSDFQDRVNSELVGNFGNFVNRILTFVYTKFDGKIPNVKIKDEFWSEIIEQVDKILELYERVELREALEEILKLSDMGNRFFQKKEPWKNRDEEVIVICANLCKILGLLIQPFIPDSSKKLLKIINCKEGDFNKIKEATIKSINQPEILFNKIEDEQIEELKKKTSKITEYKIGG